MFERIHIPRQEINTKKLVYTATGITTKRKG
jgi:hypothetical protein